MADGQSCCPGTSLDPVLPHPSSILSNKGSDSSQAQLPRPFPTPGFRHHQLLAKKPSDSHCKKQASQEEKEPKPGLEGGACHQHGIHALADTEHPLRKYNDKSV